MADGWIEWNGHENPGFYPEKEGTKVEVMVRDGGRDSGFSVEDWRWQDFGNDGDIIAYRVCKIAEGGEA